MARQPIPAALAAKLAQLPSEPGVYLFKGRDGHAIYVGKAKDLRRRVRSYFQHRHHDGRRLFRSLVRSTRDVEWVLTGTAEEALVLEALEIRSLRPRFNTALKEDREYPYIRLTAEEFPRLTAARSLEDDGSHYLGPYSDISAMHQALALVRPLCGLRTCARPLPARYRRPCLEHELGRCTAPCIGAIAAPAYRTRVQRAVAILQGREAGVLESVAQQMQAAAARQDFEHAARLRDQLGALQFMRDRQKVALDGSVDRDIVGLARRGERASWCLLVVRQGQLQGCLHHVAPCPAALDDTAAVLLFLGGHYAGAGTVPPEIQAASASPPETVLGSLAPPETAAPVWQQAGAGGHMPMQALADLNAARLLELDD